jgi:hypothetical protein
MIRGMQQGFAHDFRWQIFCRIKANQCIGSEVHRQHDPAVPVTVLLQQFRAADVLSLMPGSQHSPCQQFLTA